MNENRVQELAIALGVDGLHYTWEKMLDMVHERTMVLRNIKRDIEDVTALVRL